MTNRPDPPEADAEGARTYSVNELADEAGVTRRTVHYYIAQGLLPSSGSEGRGSRYGRGHLERLLLIRELQREHLPLAEIRRRLQTLSDQQVSDLLTVGEHLAPPRSSAYDYIQSVLAGTSSRAMPVQMAAPRPALKAAPAPGAPAPAKSAAVPPPSTGSHAVAERRAEYEPSTPALNRSQWERIPLAPDI